MLEELEIETSEAMIATIESPGDVNVKDVEVVLAGEQGTLWR